MNEKLRPPAPWFCSVTLYAVLVLLYLPLLCVVVGSFVGTDGSWTLQWWNELFGDERMLTALGHSLEIASVSSLTATVLGTAAALALHRSVFRGRAVLSGLNYVSLAVPEIVFALSLLSWFFVLQITLGRVSIFLAHVTFSVSYAMMTVGARLLTLDPQLDEAAIDLGASDAQRLWRIHWPLLRPAIVNAALLCFLLSFDDFLITFFVSGVDSQTLPILMYTSMKAGFSPKLNALAAGLWVATGFALILFLGSGNRRKDLAHG